MTRSIIPAYNHIDFCKVKTKHIVALMAVIYIVIGVVCGILLFFT